MKSAIDEGAARVACRLREAGYEAWLAGGCVRDLLLGSAPKDWDIATSAVPEEVQRLFPHSLAIGAAFGVVQVRLDGSSYEVATFRADGEYLDGRRPERVHYARTAAEDVARRDLTINALLMDPETGEVVDHVGGVRDLEAGLVRAVGPPAARFREDRLRLLRVVRFAARLGFEVESATWFAVLAEAPNLPVVSPERITAELEAMLLGPRPGEAMRLLEVSGLVEACVPYPRPAGLSDQLDLFPGAAGGLEREEQLAVGYGLCFAAHDPAEPALRERRLSRRLLRAVADLHAAAPRFDGEEVGAPQLRWVEHGSARSVAAYLACSDRARRARWDRATAWLRQNPVSSAARLRGGDLVPLGIPAGPQFKEVLGAVEDAALEGRIKTRDEALEFARSLAAPRSR